MFSMWCLIKNLRFRFSFRVVLVFSRPQQLIVNKFFKWFYSIVTCAPIWTDLSEYSLRCFPTQSRRTCFCNLSHSSVTDMPIVSSHRWHGRSTGRWKCTRAHTESLSPPTRARGRGICLLRSTTYTLCLPHPRKNRFSIFCDSFIFPVFRMHSTGVESPLCTVQQ